MALRIDVKSIHNLSQKKILLDTNIWIYLFCPLSPPKEFIVKKYSRAFNRLIQSDNKLYIEFTILSEFINRYLRLAFYIYMQNNNIDGNYDFKKDYKQTGDFKENIRLIVSTIKNKILPKVSVASPSYENRDIEKLIDNLKDKMTDFNDLHLEKLCKTNGFLLLTHDRDFSDSSLDIISGNPRILQAVLPERDLATKDTKCRQI